MAINKNAYIRYQVLDRCFRNPGRIYFIEDLIEECTSAMTELDPKSTGIKRRQLLMDIRFMESPQGWSIPLERYSFDRRKYYRYSNLNFSINNQKLNEKEIQQIGSMISLLSRIKGLPQLEWIDETIQRLEQSLQLKPAGNDIIGFEQNEFLLGREYLGELFNAILYKKVLQITYKAFTREKDAVFIIHPYFLKQYNGRWFLFGLNPEIGKLFNLALDRIIEVREIKGIFIENTTWDFTEYFEDIIGVTKPEKIEPIKIELKFTPKQTPYILTKPIHGSQRKILFDKTGLTISIHVIPNYELEQVLLSFGEDVEILSPKNFRNRMKGRMKKVIEIYS
jgi:predicted DNA-binding transcriptional regulator YafY